MIRIEFEEGGFKASWGGIQPPDQLQIIDRPAQSNPSITACAVIPTVESTYPIRSWYDWPDPTLRLAGLFTLRKKLACSCYPSETREIRSERDMEQEIEFSNHENNWFISERIFWEEDARARRFLDCFTEKLCCVKTARSREIPRWRYFWDWWLKYAYQTIYFCFFVPVKGNREGNSQFEEKESSFSPKNHRDWSTEKMRKPLKKLNKRNFADDSVKKPRFWSDLWNSVISDR